jgi:hypothetical protein
MEDSDYILEFKESESENLVGKYTPPIQGLTMQYRALGGPACMTLK